MGGAKKSTRELIELQNCVQDLERVLMGLLSVRASPLSLESRGVVGEEGKLMTCFKSGEARHFRWKSPNSAPKSGTGAPTVNESSPLETRKPEWVYDRCGLCRG